MIVIGADTHKGSHALAAVDDGTGKVRGHREITADDAGHLAAIRWARGLDDDRVWAIEDCRHVSQRLEQALIAAGERVVRVPPQRMGASRKGERERGKSDEIDAWRSRARSSRTASRRSRLPIPTSRRSRSDSSRTIATTSSPTGPGS